MRYDLPPEALSATDRQRGQLLRRAIGGGLMLVLIAGLLVARCAQARHGDDVALAHGAAHLKAALAGDATQWDRAEAAYSRAAHGAIFNAYPVFALEMVHRIKARAWGEIEPALIPAAQALAAGDFSGAQAAVAAVPRAQGYAWMTELVAAVAGAGPPPEP